MKRVEWDIEEAIVLLGLYLKYNGSLTGMQDELNALTEMYKRRAMSLGVEFDEKFRNASGLKIQLACIRFVITDGQEGMSNASQVFYQAYHLFKSNPEQFKKIESKFYQKYCQ